MKKIVRLTESSLVKLIRNVLSEQDSNYNPKGLKFGDGGKFRPGKKDDVIELQQKLIDGGFLILKSKKPTGYFGELTQDALNRAAEDAKKSKWNPKNWF
jgi:hypothetical protein